MQTYFLSFCFFQPIFIGISDEALWLFWKPNSLFSKFCVNCLLMFYFVYCNSWASKNGNRACWSICSFVAFRVLQMCYWPAKTRKNLEILRCIHVFDLVLTYGSDQNEGNWLQLLFYFIVLMGIVASIIWMSFFSCILILDWTFVVLHFDGAFAIGFQKLFGHEWVIFGVSLVGLCPVLSTSCVHGLNLDELLNCFSFWWYQVFSIVSSRGILVCSLKCL